MARMTTILAVAAACMHFFAGAAFAGEDGSGENSCRKIEYAKFIKAGRLTGFSLVFSIDGRKYLFEDIGCLPDWRHDQCSSRREAIDASATVFDHLTGQEIPALKAFYVRSDEISSTLGFGIAAFGSEKAATEFLAGRPGEVLDYDDLIYPAPPP